MGSSYYGEPNYSGGGGSSSSSRKGNNKKGSNNSEKAPKQPQRGLGVAQLEKIRLNSQLIASPSPSTNYHLPPHYPSHLLNQEEIRMQTPYSSIPTSSSSFSYGSSVPVASSASSYGFHGHQNFGMGMGQLEGANVRYSDSQPSSATPRFHNQFPSSGTAETPYFAQPSMTRQYPVEDSFQKKRKKDRGDSSDSQEPDLELRLSL